MTYFLLIRVICGLFDPMLHGIYELYFIYGPNLR
jgi:hypothetical protein